MDLSLEAIDADLQAAETGGVSRGQIALVRARIRATLMAAQHPEPEGSTPFLALPTEHGTADIQIAEGPFGDSYAVPHSAVWEDRVEAAERLLQIPEGTLLPILHAQLEPMEPERPLEGPGEPEEDDGELEDAFTEDGGTLDGLEEEDDPDVDFFDEARKARKS